MKKQIFILLVFFVLFSLFWEVSHSFLYDWSSPQLQNNISFYIQRIFISTIGDFVFLTFIFLAISLKNKNFSWISRPRKSDYVISAIMGVVIAIFIEVRASVLGSWQYASSMPLVFGIGLTPLIQLAITFLMALWFVRK